MILRVDKSAFTYCLVACYSLWQLSFGHCHSQATNINKHMVVVKIHPFFKKMYKSVLTVMILKLAMPHAEALFGKASEILGSHCTIVMFNMDSFFTKVWEDYGIKSKREQCLCTIYTGEDSQRILKMINYILKNSFWHIICATTSKQKWFSVYI